MSYRCVREIKAEDYTIPAGTVIEGIERNDVACMAFVTFVVDGVHFAVRYDMFEEFFEEVES